MLQGAEERALDDFESHFQAVVGRRHQLVRSPGGCGRRRQAVLTAEAVEEGRAGLSFSAEKELQAHLLL